MKFAPVWTSLYTLLAIAADDSGRTTLLLTLDHFRWSGLLESPFY
jgi:hypothetical protein